MAVTQRGIYHNLKESEYATSNSEVAFFFSSMFYLGKFMDEHKEHRVMFRKRLERVMDLNNLDVSFLADIHLYKKIEKRGFRIVDENKDTGEDEFSWEEIHLFALQKTIKKNTLDWFETHALK